MRTKLKARQAVYVAAGIPVADADFDTLDGPSRCAEINQYVYQWAIDNAGMRTAVRFKQLGQKLYMGTDVRKTAGYDWINTAMTYTPAVINGEDVILINSTALATPVDYFQKNSQGLFRHRAGIWNDFSHFFSWKVCTIARFSPPRTHRSGYMLMASVFAIL
jgi:hypothetical protein